MTRGQLDPAVARRHLLALDAALQVLRRHQGRSVVYLDVDVELLHRLLNEHLEDFSVFARHVAAYLESSGVA